MTDVGTDESAGSPVDRESLVRVGSTPPCDSSPDRYATLKAEADKHGRSVSEEVEAWIEQLTNWKAIFQNERAMVARLGEQTDSAIEAVMHQRKWEKTVDPRYGGPVFTRPGQIASPPPSGFFDPEAEAREKEARIEAQQRQQQRFEETIERAVSRALAKTRLTIGNNGAVEGSST